MAPSVKQITTTVMALLIASVTLPMSIAQIYTGGYTMTDASVNSTVITVYQTLIPIIAVISIVIMFVSGFSYVRSKRRGSKGRRR